MKPIKLRMKNFGSYLDEEIDFNKLSGLSMYLISGPTGSGKTTIYDGIVYSLYGETTSSDRSGESMRSEYANYKDPTVVTLEFEHKGKKYVISREPKYDYEEKGKTKTKKAKVNLKYPEGDEIQEITKKRQIDNFIHDLLGVNAKQFTQIILLPQGKFQSFLRANSNEKEVILRDIFGTKLYQEWIDKLVTKVKQNYVQNNKLDTKISVLKKQLKFENKPTKEWLIEVEDALKIKKNEVVSQKRETEKLQKEVNKLSKEVQTQENLIKLYEKKENLEKEESKYLGINEEILQKKKEIQDLEWYQSNYHEFEKERELEEKISLKLSEIEKTKKDLSKINDQINKLVKKQNKLEELDIDKKELDLNELKQAYPKVKKAKELKSKVETIIKEQQSLSEIIAKKEEVLEGKVKELTDLENKKIDVTELQYDLGIMELKRKDLEKVQQNKEKISTLIVTLPKLEEDFFASLDNNSNKETIIRNAEKFYHNKYLVQFLDSENKARQKNIPSQKQIDFLQRKLKNTETEQENLFIKINNLKDIISGEKEKIRILNNKNQLLLEKKNFILNEIQTELKDVHGNHNLDELKDEIKIAEEQIECLNKEKAEIDSLLQKQNVLLAQLKTTLEIRKQSLNQYKKEHILSKNRIEELLRNKEFDKNILDDLKNKIDDLETLKDFVKKYEQSLVEIKAQLSQIKEEIGDAPIPEIKETKLLFNEVNKTYEEKQKEYHQIELELKQDKKIQEQVADLYKQQGEKEEEISQMQELVDIMGGKGQLKLSLERYVLRKYFKNVLQVANYRLKMMTHSRYKLQLDEKYGRHATDTGLELNIFDANAGKYRSVKTLSGGESFVVSLALSLALGEVIEEEKGKVKIETIYIDEGFGTLDKSTLKEIMGILQQVSQTSSLSIGIISHIDGIREEVEGELQVKNKNGKSKIEYKLER